MAVKYQVLSDNTAFIGVIKRKKNGQLEEVEQMKIDRVLPLHMKPKVVAHSTGHVGGGGGFGGDFCDAKGGPGEPGCEQEITRELNKHLHGSLKRKLKDVL